MSNADWFHLLPLLYADVLSAIFQFGKEWISYFSRQILELLLQRGGLEFSHCVCTTDDMLLNVIDALLRHYDVSLWICKCIHQFAFQSEKAYYLVSFF